MKRLAVVGAFACWAAGCKLIPDSVTYGCQQASDCPTDQAYRCVSQTCVPAGVTIDGGDAGRDAGEDAGQDAGADAGRDAGPDAGPDGGEDAGVDAGPDAGLDAGLDAGTDAGADAGLDAGADAGVDAGLPDSGPVRIPDAGSLLPLVIGTGPFDALSGAGTVVMAGQAIGGTAAGGLFVSVDGGAWQDVSGPLLYATDGELAVSRLAFDSALGGAWYVLMASGRIFATGNGGLSWTAVGTPDSGFDPASLTQLLVSGSTLFAVGSQFYASSWPDGGTPSLAPANFSLSNVGSLALDSAGQRLFVGLPINSAVAVVDLSTQQITSTVPLASCGGGSMDYLLDPTGGEHLWLGTSAFSSMTLNIDGLDVALDGGGVAMPTQCALSGNIANDRPLVSHLGTLAYLVFGQTVETFTLPFAGAAAACPAMSGLNCSTASNVPQPVVALAPAFGEMWGLSSNSIFNLTAGSPTIQVNQPPPGVTVTGFASAASSLFAVGLDHNVYNSSGATWGTYGAPLTVTSSYNQARAVAALDGQTIYMVGIGEIITSSTSYVPTLYRFTTGNWTQVGAPGDAYPSLAALRYPDGGGVFINYGGGVDAVAWPPSGVGPTAMPIAPSLVAASPPWSAYANAFLFGPFDGGGPEVAITNDGATVGGYVGLPFQDALVAAAVNPVNGAAAIVDLDGGLWTLSAVGNSVVGANHLCAGAGPLLVSALAYDADGGLWGAGPAGVYDLQSCALAANAFPPGPPGAFVGVEPLSSLAIVPGAPAHGGLYATGIGHTYQLQ